MHAHPAAELFPLMEGAEFQALVDDIKAHGQHDPIVIHEGKILDGRNRFRACEAAQRVPKTVQWDCEGDVIQFVVSKNLHRRHLNESQRALIAARLMAAVEISTPVHDVSGKFTKTGRMSVGDAADLLNVNRHTVFSAKKVLSEGTKDELRAVERGEAAVSTIAKHIRKDESPERRAKRRDEPLSQSGKNPERIQRQQINAEVWGRVRDALTHFTSLPAAADVVAIARANDRTGLVEARLTPALQWLKEFSDEWNRSAQG